jgi:hypothetical protein
LRERLADRGIELICPHRRGPRPTSDSGWTAIAALSKALDRGTHNQLASSLPTAGDPLRVLPSPLSQLRQTSLPYDCVTQVLKRGLAESQLLASRPAPACKHLCSPV